MVLTAGHCVEPFIEEPVSLLVAAGSDHDLSHIYCSQTLDGPNGKLCDLKAKDNYTKGVKKIHLHPHFTSELSLENKTALESWERNAFPDIALLEVEPFDLSDEFNILPGCLFESDEFSFGSKLLGAGSLKIQFLTIR